MHVLLKMLNKVMEVIKFHEVVSVYVKQRKWWQRRSLHRKVFIWKQLDARPSFEHWLPKQLGGGAEKWVLKKYGWDDLAISNKPIKPLTIISAVSERRTFFVKYS